MGRSCVLQTAERVKDVHRSVVPPKMRLWQTWPAASWLRALPRAQGGSRAAAMNRVRPKSGLAAWPACAVARRRALHGSPPSTVTAVQATTTETYDGQGRLQRVDEPNGTTTTYGYDVGNRLATVAIDDHVHQPQRREFKY